MKGYLWYVIGIIFLIGGAIWLGSVSSANSYSTKDPAKPQAQTSEDNFDFGKMNVNETKSHDFTIKNQGKNDLTLSQVATSCDCTYAKIIKADGSQSPTLTMHAMNSYQTSLKSGETITLQITYQPSIMPVEGPVERYVTVSTNDPDHPKLEFKITARVVK